MKMCEERYDLDKLKALIDKTTGNMPHIQEILNGLLYHIERLESDPVGLGAFFNGYDDLPNEEKRA